VFIYCFTEDLKERLEAEGNELIYTEDTELGRFWVFSFNTNFNFTKEDKQNAAYVIRNKLNFSEVRKCQSAK